MTQEERRKLQIDIITVLDRRCYAGPNDVMLQGVHNAAEDLIKLFEKGWLKQRKNTNR